MKSSRQKKSFRGVMTSYTIFRLKELRNFSWGEFSEDVSLCFFATINYLTFKVIRLEISSSLFITFYLQHLPRNWIHLKPFGSTSNASSIQMKKRIIKVCEMNWKFSSTDLETEQMRDTPRNVSLLHTKKYQISQIKSKKSRTSYLLPLCWS